MRLIDADALKELFSEVIGHIAKKPEMNGNLEHMIRASAMVIQMIDDAPSIQVESNPLEKCYTCKHVYQRVSDADTLYCRCRKGCRYEEFKPKRSNNDSGRHED